MSETPFNLIYKPRGHADIIDEIIPNPSDPSLVVTVSKDSTIRVVKFTEKDVIFLATYNGKDAKWSPKGKFLLYTDNLEKIHLLNQKLEELSTIDGLKSLTWSSMEQMVFIEYRNTVYKVRFFDPADSVNSKDLGPAPSPLKFSWSSNGLLVFVGYRDWRHVARVFDPSKHEIQDIGFIPSNPCFSWSSTGLLAFVGLIDGKGIVRIFDPTKSEPEKIRDLCQVSYDPKFSWSPKGELVFFDFKADERILYFYNPSNPPNKLQSLGPSISYHVDWSITNILAYYEYREGIYIIHIFDPKKSEEIKKLGPIEYLHHYTWSPTGLLAFFEHRDGKYFLRSYDPTEPEIVHDLGRISPANLAFSWSPKGELAFIKLKEKDMIGCIFDPRKPQSVLEFGSCIFSQRFSWSPLGLLAFLEERKGKFIAHIFDPLKNETIDLGFVPIYPNFTWSSKGKLVFRGLKDEQMMARLFDPNKPELIQEFSVANNVTRFQWSLTGILAILYCNRLSSIFNQTGKCLWETKDLTFSKIIWLDSGNIIACERNNIHAWVEDRGNQDTFLYFMLKSDVPGSVVASSLIDNGVVFLHQLENSLSIRLIAEKQQPQTIPFPELEGSISEVCLHKSGRKVAVLLQSADFSTKVITFEIDFFSNSIKHLNSIPLKLSSYKRKMQWRNEVEILLAEPDQITLLDTENSTIFNYPLQKRKFQYQIRSFPVAIEVSPQGDYVAVAFEYALLSIINFNNPNMDNAEIIHKEDVVYSTQARPGEITALAWSSDENLSLSANDGASQDVLKLGISVDIGSDESSWYRLSSVNIESRCYCLEYLDANLIVIGLKKGAIRFFKTDGTFQDFNLPFDGELFVHTRKDKDNRYYIICCNQAGFIAEASIRPSFGHTLARHVCRKVIILGHTEIGKTALVKALMDRNKPFEESQNSTEGLDRYEYPLEDKEIKRSIVFWDFGGQDRFTIHHHVFLTGTHLALLAFRPPQKAEGKPEDRIKELAQWLTILERQCGHKVHNMIVATRIDRYELTRTPKEIESFCKKYRPGLADKGVFVTSARTKQGISELYNCIVKEILSEQAVEYVPELFEKIDKEIKKLADEKIYQITEEKLIKKLVEPEETALRDMDGVLNILEARGKILRSRVQSSEIVILPEFLSKALGRVMGLLLSKGEKQGVGQLSDIRKELTNLAEEERIIIPSDFQDQILKLITERGNGFVIGEGDKRYLLSPSRVSGDSDETINDLPYRVLFLAIGQGSDAYNAVSTFMVVEKHIKVDSCRRNIIFLKDPNIKDLDLRIRFIEPSEDNYFKIEISYSNLDYLKQINKKEIGAVIYIKNHGTIYYWEGQYCKHCNSVLNPENIFLPRDPLKGPICRDCGAITETTFQSIFTEDESKNYDKIDSLVVLFQILKKVEKVEDQQNEMKTDIRSIKSDTSGMKVDMSIIIRTVNELFNEINRLLDQYLKEDERSANIDILIGQMAQTVDQIMTEVKTNKELVLEKLNSIEITLKNQFQTDWDKIKDVWARYREGKINMTDLLLSAAKGLGKKVFGKFINIVSSGLIEI